MPPGSGFAFGPFQLDPRARHLRRDGQLVSLPARQFDLLHALVARPGEILPKDELIKAAWPDVDVTDNSLAQAIMSLRGVIETDGSPCAIATARGLGYRFTGGVERIEAPRRDPDLDALLAPHRNLIEGRAALETLERDRIAVARRTFERLVAQHHSDATMHVGLANACALAFEATRADAVPDTGARDLALSHAREACRLNPHYGEAWATLGFVLELGGNRVDALAALGRAVTLEPDNWRHHLRLAYASWGEGRLRAARQALVLLPDCAMAHWLVATVFVARGAPAQAERELDAALAMLAGETNAPERFSVVALYWLKGLLLHARGEDAEAAAMFEREIALEPRGQLYARECCANAWYATGALRLGRGDRAGARAAFEETIARVPRHPLAHAGLALSAGATTCEVLDGASRSMDVAVARAALRVAADDASGAATTVAAALAAAPPGNAGWLLPIEPLLDIAHAPDAWAPVLAALSGRAS
jgi:DNA-binding winged helix-turn-helix (wHTH) protein/Flp pilus assembly protein TadD